VNQGPQHRGPAAAGGWRLSRAALPTIVLQKQAALDLKPIDVNILMQIAKHWWGTESAPQFPSIRARAWGLSPPER